MSIELMQKLEDKVDNAVETIELLNLEIKELEDKISRLTQENGSLQTRQVNWEKNLNTMLEKLEAVGKETISKGATKEQIIHKEEPIPA